MLSYGHGGTHSWWTGIRCRNGVPARLSRCLQPLGDGAARPGDHHRRVAQEPRDGRVHLREGAQVRRTRVRTPIACCTRRCAAAGRARAASHARPGTRRFNSSSSGCSGPSPTPAANRSCRTPTAARHGLLTQDNLDAQLWRRFGTSRLARTVCAAPTGAANMALYGKMPSVTYQDYPEARLIILWGVNPVRVGHPPRALRAGRAKARREARGRRPADDAAREVGGRPSRGEDRHRMSPSRSPFTAFCSRTAMQTRHFSAITPPARTRFANAPNRGRSRRRPRLPE